MTKNCGGGNDLCGSLAPYETLVKAEQMLNNIAKYQSPKTLFDKIIG